MLKSYDKKNLEVIKTIKIWPHNETSKNNFSHKNDKEKTGSRIVSHILFGEVERTVWENVSGIVLKNQ